MKRKSNAARPPIKQKGVRAENAPSSQSPAPSRATKSSSDKRPKKAGPGPKAARAAVPPLKPVAEEPDHSPASTALYGASWVSPSPAMVSSLSADDALLLRGITPGSSSAQWYHSLSHQLSRRTMDGVAETAARPASANGALVIPHNLIETDAIAHSLPVSPSPRGVEKRPVVPTHTSVVSDDEEEEDDDDDAGSEADEAPSPVAASSPLAPASGAARVPVHCPVEVVPPATMESDEEEDEDVAPEQAPCQERDELPSWLRTDEATPLPRTTNGTSPSSHNGDRRRTDLDRLQSLRRMMDVNNKAADTFSSRDSAIEDSPSTPSRRSGDRHSQGGGAAKAKGHHLPPLPPPASSASATLEDVEAVEITMSHNSDTAPSLHGHTSSPFGRHRREGSDHVLSDAYRPPNALDRRAARKDVAAATPPTSGRVVVMSLGDRAGQRDTPGDAAKLLKGDVPPVERMAPKLREKRQLALMKAKHKHALPPLA